jgi:hypothetical protein
MGEHARRKTIWALWEGGQMEATPEKNTPGVCKKAGEIQSIRQKIVV